MKKKELEEKKQKKREYIEKKQKDKERKKEKREYPDGKDNRCGLRIQIPYTTDFIPNKYEIIYIEKNYNKNLNNFFKNNYNGPTSTYAGRLRFVYLPLTECTPIEEIVKYLNPSLNNEEIEKICSEQSIIKAQEFYSYIYENFQSQWENSLKYIDGIFDSGFIRFKKGLFDEVFNIPEYEFSFHPIKYRNDKQMFAEIQKYLSGIGDDGLFQSKRQLYGTNDIPIDADEEFYSEIKNLTKEIEERIERLRAIGVNQMFINKLVLTPPKPSRLVITTEYRIFLPDFNNIEITMGPLPKTIFFFYLKHPEGVDFKELVDYKKELLGIYTNISNRENYDKMKRSINDIVDATKNSINEKCSRIREASIKEFDEGIAVNYYVTNIEGRIDDKSVFKIISKKRISLDRNLITDESGILGIMK